MPHVWPGPELNNIAEHGMFGSEILEVAIGVIFVFLLVSIIASAIREALEALLHTRAAYLERGIRELLHDRDAKPGGLARAFFEHPLIYSLFSSEYKPKPYKARLPIFVTGRQLPSYIPARNFATAIMDIAVRGVVTDAVSADGAAPEFNLQTMRSNITQLGSPSVQRVLLTAIDSSDGDMQQARLAVQDWFDSGMDRVSGWYKRSTSWILFWVGFAVAFGFNIDGIAVARFLYHNDAARSVIVAQAEKAVGDTNFLKQSYVQARTDLQALDLPIGWNWQRDSVTSASGAAATIATSRRPWYQALPGWLLTALAAMFGAPFWFDLLNKFMVIRSTVKPHEKSPEESSEDRQQPSSRDESVATSDQRTVVIGTSTVAPAIVVRSESERQFAMMPPSTGQIRDAQSDIDGCDVEMDPGQSGNTVVVTRDEDLPPAEGGVAE
jgi:hypothetical protein